MGKGRRRNTAKTGDKALYAKRPSQDGAKERRSDDAIDADDDMYDRVDRYHNRREQDFLRLDGKEGQDSDDDDNDGNYDNVRPVMDLGIGASDDEDSDDDSDGESSSEEDGGRDTSKMPAKGARADDDSDHDDDAATSDDGDEDEEEEEPEDVRDWGKRKSSYYHGDTADLEIGQDQDDAFLEEEAAKEIHKARMTNLAEEDFEIEDDDVEEGVGKQGKDDAAAASRNNVHRLTRREKRKIIERQSPEFLPLVEHFTGVVRELHERTNVAVQALFEGEEGAAQVRWLSWCWFVRGFVRSLDTHPT
jgi:U3 small nucleolar RNA-associated protein 3